MENKKLIQILLPLYDEKGRNFPSALYITIKKELTERFGGLTVYARSPATGLWKENDQKVTRDEIVVYEVIVNDMDHQYWRNYKKTLEQRFQQDEFMIRCIDISLL